MVLHSSVQTGRGFTQAGNMEKNMENLFTTMLRVGVSYKKMEKSQHTIIKLK